MEEYNPEQMSQPQPWMVWVPQNQWGVKQDPCLSGPMDKDEQTAEQANSEFKFSPSFDKISCYHQM